jgi:hypothetical protein
MVRGRTSWTALAVLAWMGLFALFSLAPSHMCETSITGMSFCVSGQPPIGLEFMPMRLGPESLILDAAFSATKVLAALLAAAGLIWLIRQMRKPSDKKRGRSDDRPL